MAFAKLRGEERIGLVLAVAAHAALIAVLALRPHETPPPPPERMSVTLSDDAGLTSTSPQPHAEAAPDLAPTLGEAAPQPSLSPPVETPLPLSHPVIVKRPAPVPQASPSPQPVARPSHAPRHKDAAADAPAKPVRNHPVADPITAAIAASAAAHKTRQPVGGSRIGADFLKGVTSANTTGKAQTPPAETAGPAVKAALAGAISRQLKPHWTAPQGADADQLVTILSWNLNRDGSLAGEPHVVRQDGITDSNRPQAQRHAEQAIRAVELAAPFVLPPEYYDAWKHVASFRFDRKLSQ